MIYVTGDTHGEIGRFINEKEPIYRTLTEKDTLIICGDFGFVWYEADKKDRWQEAYLETLSKLPFQTLFVDGNHENFNALNDYPVEMWNGGKVHIIKKNAFGEPKVIHLMRGQIFLIDGKKIFTFGGGNSIDKDSRVLFRSWWPDEMPSDKEYRDAIKNLKTYNYKVDYIITHAAPEDTMCMFYPFHDDEKPLNNFLEYVRENTKYSHWYFGHLHDDRDLPRKQTMLWFQLRRIDTNEVIV